MSSRSGFRIGENQNKSRLLSLSVAASRILLGMHFLSDVVAGAAIGSGLAYGAVELMQRVG